VPPSARVLRVAGIACIAIGVLVFIVYGLARGAITDVGPWTMLIVPVVFGIGALLIARARDRIAPVDES